MAIKLCYTQTQIVDMVGIDLVLYLSHSWYCSELSTTQASLVPKFIVGALYQIKLNKFSSIILSLEHVRFHDVEEVELAAY